MPHVLFVPFNGFRVRERELRALGMSLPGLTQRAAAVAELPALGLLTLAGLTPKHWTCGYRPAATANKEFIARIIAERPELVAVSALTASVEEAYCFCDKLLQAGIPVVVGGLHVSVCPEEAEPYCNAVVVGNAEPIWRQLLADVEAGKMASRYIAPRVQTLDEWPLPRFDLLGSAPPRFTLQTQRGCPLACEFCGASRLLSRFQEKPIEAIGRELDAIRAIQPRPLIELADDNTFAGQRDWAAFFDLFQQSGVRWFTESDWRLGERQDLLAGLADAGCVQVLIGIESLVFRYPGFGKKRAELDRIMRAVEAIQAAGVAVNGCFILGADGETPASINRLVEFILHSPLAEVQITLQTPFPGTELYNRLRDAGRLLPNRGWSHYTLFDVTYQPDSMTVHELEAAFRKVLQRVFCREASIRREGIRRDIWHRNRRLRR